MNGYETFLVFVAVIAIWSIAETYIKGKYK